MELTFTPILDFHNCDDQSGCVIVRIGNWEGNRESGVFRDGKAQVPTKGSLVYRDDLLCQLSSTIGQLILPNEHDLSD